MKDPALLKRLRDKEEPFVLVTFDNKMPLRHGRLLTRYKTTLAVVDKDAQPDDLTREEYWREVIHRHIHRMVEQEPGTKFLYSRRQRRPIP